MNDEITNEYDYESDDDFYGNDIGEVVEIYDDEQDQHLEYVAPYEIGSNRTTGWKNIEDNNLNDNEVSEPVTMSTTQSYLSLKVMKKSIVDGTFDWSKTARSVLFLKKHKCASSTLREALRNYLYWRGLTEEISTFQALGGCYPSRWDPKCRPPTELKSHVRNILYHHRLNLDKQLPLMFPDTKLVTTVREPVSLLYRHFSLL